MLEVIAVIIASIFVLLVVLICVLVMVVVLVTDAKEYKANKHAALYQGTILSSEGIEKYDQMISGKARLISPKSAYKSYFKYEIQFWINGREYVESVLFKEQKQIGEVVEVKCIWNGEEALHPIDIGKVERSRKCRIGFLLLVILLILMAGVYLLA